MKLVSNAEMTRIDRESQERFGIPGVVLMESAGLAAWQRFQRLLPDQGRNIVFVAGPGNNGGDALVMARYCRICSSHRAVVVLVRDAVKGDAATQLSIVRALEIPVLVWESDTDGAEHEIAASDWIVDGIAGTGIIGSLREPASDLVGAINRANAKVVSIDCPSGVGDSFRLGSPVVSAENTLTMGLPKRCLFLPASREHCGKIELVPVTFPTSLTQDPRIRAELVVPDELRQLLPRLRGDAYKKSRGTVAVFAGSVGFTGAAALCGEAALRSRAGLVTLYVDSPIYPTLAAKLTSVMVRPVEQDEVGSYAGNVEAAVVGPGWGLGSDRDQMLRSIIDSAPGGVLDADAIGVLGRIQEPFGLSAEWVLTPHPGELARLNGSSAREVLDDPAAAVSLGCERSGAVIALKAHTTWIGHPDGSLSVVDGMNPALGTAGSGDVLAGIIGGMIPNLGAWAAARAGVLLHSLAGSRLLAKSGLFLAEELLPEVSLLAATSQSDALRDGT